LRKTCAILSDESETGRSHVKAIESLAREGALPVELVETVSTGDFSTWKQKALELQERVDAFFVTLYASLKDEQGAHVSDEEVAKWYLTHIRIPETGRSERQVRQGLLCGVDETGYDHGFAVGEIVRDILTNGANPATYPPRFPERGPSMVNRQRAQILGITLVPGPGIDTLFDTAIVLQASEGASQ
jgi:ABC-type uncharacterized transport system substrate-binding protein